MCVSGTSDLFPAISSEPCASVHVEQDRSSIAEFSAADIFRHSPLGDMLNSLKNLSLSDDGEFRFPPTAHFIATVEDLTDMLDYAGEEEAQNPPFTGRWTAASSYDVYMVDTPKTNSGDDKENPAKEDPPKT